jgi:hypothetical protein
MSFPVGSMIVLGRSSGLRIWKEGKELAIEPGSFLDTWFRRQKID